MIVFLPRGDEYIETMLGTDRHAGELVSITPLFPYPTPRLESRPPSLSALFP